MIKRTSAYYCVREMSKIPRVLICIQSAKCYCFVFLIWRCSCKHWVTKLIIVSVSPLFYFVLNIRLDNTHENLSEPQCLAPNQ